jgi:hypothetical protein
VTLAGLAANLAARAAARAGRKIEEAGVACEAGGGIADAERQEEKHDGQGVGPGETAHEHPHYKRLY